MKKICLLAALLLALSAPAAQAAQGGSVTGTTHTKGTERAMQIRSDEMLSTGTVSWDVAAPKNKKPQQRADIWLIREDFAFSKLSDEAIDVLYERQEIPAGAPIYRTHSDAKGAYRFEEIPPGRYYLMTLDPFGKPFDEGAAECAAREELFARLPRLDEFEFRLVGIRNCLVQKIEVRAGQETHIRLAAVRF